MSLRELTNDKHAIAEDTLFMHALFEKKLPLEMWMDYVYNKMLVYGAIETKARAEGFLDDLPEVERAYALYLDYKNMSGGVHAHKFKPSAIDYHRYILDLEPGKILAHIYVWYMGDLIGGQLIKEMIPTTEHRSLDFNDIDKLKERILAKVDDSLAVEANIAFDWAIRIMDEYADSLTL